MRERAKSTVAQRRGQRTDPDWPAVYEIKVEGHLDSAWTGWFEGMSIALEDDGVTRLTGAVVDQAALHGLLKRVRDLGVPLVSVIRLEAGPAPQPTEEGDRDAH
ncbi:MAG: hypothetical protein Q7W16_07815 [Coriobacteriia bacterium]|nr:hypothetical protein [Coriobacteriia bacterium]